MAPLVNLRLLIICLCLTSFNSYSQNDSTVLRYELKRLDSLFGYRTKLSFVSSGTISSLPSQEIKIALRELNKISSVAHKPTRLYLMRFIIAHEFAHQIQYYRYRNDPIYLTSDPVSRMLIETQADILAGFFFFLLSPEILVYRSDQLDISPILSEIFRAVHSLGISENTVGTHPSRRDRMLACRLGMTNGLSYMLDLMIKRDAMRGINVGLTPAEYQKYFLEQMRFIDIVGNEDIIDWSYRQAKKIVNYDRKVANDIVLITPEAERSRFDRDNNNPYCYYNLDYKNIGSRSIYIEMEVFVAHVRRDDPESGSFYKKVNVKHYKFNLRPGEIYSIRDRLSWLQNDQDTEGYTALMPEDMPRIAYPSAHTTDGVISCVYSGYTSGEVAGEALQYLELSSRSGQIINFSIFFNTLINACLIDPSTITSGIGTVLNETNEIAYKSSIQYDEGITYIHYDREDETVSAAVDFPKLHPDVAKQRYDDLKQLLTERLQEHEITENVSGENRLITFIGERYNVQLRLFVNRSVASPASLMVMNIYF